MKRAPANRIEIDLEACTGCKICVNVCFVNAISWGDKDEEPVAAYPEDCVWCLACEEACPAQCIEVIPTIPGRLPAQF
ncbi:ferredoxin family protein [Thermodesulfobacteriota bacterium]